MASKSLLVCFIVLSFSLNSFMKPLEETNTFTAWLKRWKVSSSDGCEVCKLLSLLAQATFLANRIEDEVVSVAQRVCELLKIEDDRVCTQVILEFRTEVLTVIDKVFLSPTEVCGSLFGPTCAHRRDPNEFWNITVPGKKPPVNPVPPPKVRIRHLIFMQFCQLINFNSYAMILEDFLGTYLTAQCLH